MRESKFTEQQIAFILKQADDGERKARLLDQMELQLEELEAFATEAEVAVQTAAAQDQQTESFQRKRPSRKPFPGHLPRERIVIPAPEQCPCCGSTKLS